MTNSSPLRLSYKSSLILLAGFLVLTAGGLLFCGEQHEARVAVPVTFEHIPHDLIVLRDTPLVVEARVKGLSRILKNLSSSQFSCRIDLSAAKPGPVFVKVSPEMINVPWHVSVLDTDPASLAMTVDRRMEKVVPIVPDLNKDPASGYVIPKVVATPCTIRLTGPATVLEEISAVRTTPVEVGGLTETVRKKVALNLNHSPHVRAADESLVEVEIVVEQKIVEKWLDIAVRATGDEYKHVITPDRIEILLRGPMNTLENLSQYNGIEAFVNLEGLEPGTYVRRAVIKPPLNTTLVEAKPEVFTVKVLSSRGSKQS